MLLSMVIVAGIFLYSTQHRFSNITFHEYAGCRIPPRCVNTTVSPPGLAQWPAVASWPVMSHHFNTQLPALLCYVRFMLSGKGYWSTHPSLLHC